MIFGSLIPNQLDLSGGNILGDATELVASANSDIISFSFTYIGSKAVTINTSEISIKQDTGDSCGNATITKYATGEEKTGVERFIRNQVGVIKIKCDGLIESDVFEGQVKIKTQSQKSGLEVPSTGRIRVKVTS